MSAKIHMRPLSDTVPELDSTPVVHPDLEPEISVYTTSYASPEEPSPTPVAMPTQVESHSGAGEDEDEDAMPVVNQEDVEANTNYLPTIERTVNVSGGFGGVMLDPSETAGMDATQKNKEFFKRMKAVRSYFITVSSPCLFLYLQNV